MNNISEKATAWLRSAAGACLSVFLCVTLAGCAANGPVAPTQGGPSGQTDGAQATTQVIRDSVGRNVQAPIVCEHIAALDSFSGEALVMAGAGPYMVAAPNGVSSDVILKLIFPELDEVPAPSSGGTVNIESLWSVKPDIVLVKSSMYYSKDEIEKLEKLGIPYLVVEYSTIEEQIAALEMIGRILPPEQSERMGAIVEAYRTTVARVEERVARIPASETVKVYHSINQAVMTDGSSSIGADWITRTGAIDVSAKESSTDRNGDFQATLEQVFAWDPDIVICNEATTADYLLTDSKWTGLRAVIEQHVYPIPIGATRWGQRGSVETWFAMLWLGKLAYPDYFADIDLHAEVVDFYGSVLGVDVDDDLYDQMISGRDMRKRPTGDNARNS